MVHDPRVTSLMSRLGGLYRDPARVDRDASSLLKSTVGLHLIPGIAPLVENNGDSCNCLVLQGTIAIVFRGNTYQLLVDIYLPGGYPRRPPVSFVRLAKNMYLKENHPHVGKDGMVYMPYTHEWNARTHTLIEMVVAMSSVFSADPPVFTRSAPAPPPPPPAAAASSRPPPPAYDPSHASSSTNSRETESDRYMQEQIEKIMAREAAEANAAAEAVRKAQEEEKEREEQLAAQKRWEEKKTEQLRDQVNQKIVTHLQSYAQKAKATAQADWRDQQLLKHSKEAIDKDVEELHRMVQSLEENIGIVDGKTQEIQKWLADNNESKEGEVSVDDLCQPSSKLHSQMLDLSAENASITDALYFVDRAMYSGQMDCTTHLKTVRKLAKQQFLVRAHLIKINQVLLQNGTSR